MSRRFTQILQIRVEPNAMEARNFEPICIGFDLRISVNICGGNGSKVCLVRIIGVCYLVSLLNLPNFVALIGRRGVQTEYVYAWRKR